MGKKKQGKIWKKTLFLNNLAHFFALSSTRGLLEYAEGGIFRGDL
jgi:hypothetical protein